MDSIASETVCYPAQLVHGHIASLIKRGVRKIFYPCLPFSLPDSRYSGDSFNCPVVTSYPETIKANAEQLEESQVRLYHPFVALDNPRQLARRLCRELREEDLRLSEVEAALELAYAERDKYIAEVRRQGEQILAYLRRNKQPAVVLLGRPYHVDPEVNHGLPGLIRSMGLAVLSEDAVVHLAPVPPLRVIDQWNYHSRLYRSASFVAQNKDLQLEAVQLNFFGCGLDAITIEQVQEILAAHSRLHTVIKLDEINNLGAVRIRLRSMLAALRERQSREPAPPASDKSSAPPLFTADMRRDYTILAPQMAPIHYQFISIALQKAGYRLVVVDDCRRAVVDTGLKYAHNDVCFPAILVIGQMLEALRSGQYDTHRTAIMFFQTAGGCRASNYTSFLRKALDDSGFDYVPIMSVWGRQSPGFSFTPPMFFDIVKGSIYGDLLMKTVLRLRPYEREEGAVRRLYESWTERCQRDMREGNRRSFKRNVRALVRDFDTLPLREEGRRPRVGIVGEIMVKYAPLANGNLVELLEREGAEVVMPDFLNFFRYCAYDWVTKRDLLGGSWMEKSLAQFFLWTLKRCYRVAYEALRDSRRFEPATDIEELAALAQQHISLGHNNGEGWLITGEIAHMVSHGTPNIVCVQPFGCLPNHVVGKGMLKHLRHSYPGANLVAIDYDSGLSEVNQLNRLKLMMAVAKENN